MQFNRWQVFWGGALILFGVLFLLANMGIMSLTIGQIFTYGWPLFLVLIGVLILLPGSQRGDWTWNPGTGAGKRDEIFDGKEIRTLDLSHGLGDYYVDLAHAVFPDGVAHVKASHGLGNMKIRLPKDLAVQVKATVGIGDVQLFDERADGMGASIERKSPDYDSAARRLELEASLGMGDLRISRAE